MTEKVSILNALDALEKTIDECADNICAARPENIRRVAQVGQSFAAILTQLEPLKSSFNIEAMDERLNRVITKLSDATVRGVSLISADENRVAEYIAETGHALSAVVAQKPKWKKVGSL